MIGPHSTATIDAATAAAAAAAGFTADGIGNWIAMPAFVCPLNKPKQSALGEGRVQRTRFKGGDGLGAMGGCLLLFMTSGEDAEQWQAAEALREDAVAR